MSRSPSSAELLAAARRTLALAALAALAACSTLEGAQHSTAPARAPASTAGSAPVPDGAPGPVPGTDGSATVVPEATPDPAPSSVAPRPPSATAGATQALLAQSRAARAAGSYSQASARIERALRIAPSDARLWVELGEIELASGDTAQAATLARKALTLAADDSAVVADAQKLLRAAGGR